MSNQKSLTLEDLGKFTEEVLLPAFEKMLDDKFKKELMPFKQEIYEKIDSINHNLKFIRQDIERLEAKIDRIAQANSEDITAVNGDVKKLKIKVEQLEKEIAIIKSSQKS